MRRGKQTIRNWLTALAWGYFTYLFGWLGLYLLVGDRIGYLGLVNTLGLYFFLPLPVMWLLAVFLARRSVWAGTLLGTIVFLWLWGGLFLPPRFHVRVRGPSLKVMTYNTLGFNLDTQAVMDVLRAENPDVVFLQELNFSLATALEADLGGDYPFQVLKPVDGVSGMGVISKYPLTPLDDRIPLEWVGPPQVMSMDWEGREVTLVNFHMWATGLGPPGWVAENFRQRERQASALASFAENTKGLLIIAGDANSTPLNTAYHLITGRLEDSWLEGGFGFGHTFPGSNIPGSNHPRIAGRPVPKWLVRIDYVFHSPEWVATEAHTGLFDLVSDHRGVVVELKLER